MTKNVLFCEFHLKWLKIRLVPMFYFLAMSSYILNFGGTRNNQHNFFFLFYWDNISLISRYFRCWSEFCFIVIDVILIISYYSGKDSDVLIAFLDAAKAFDRIDFCNLFRKLLDRNMTPCCWGSCSTCIPIKIGWGSIAGTKFSTCNGWG